MRVIEYGLGGYDESKPNNNIIDEYDIEESIDDITIPREVLIPISSIDTLQSTLDDPATNSIAKIKTALTEFLEELRG
jgi:hypothetical protein